MCMHIHYSEDIQGKNWLTSKWYNYCSRYFFSEKYSTFQVTSNHSHEVHDFLPTKYIADLGNDLF